MEQTRRYQLKLNQLVKAVTGFKKILEIDEQNFSETLKDAVMNGQIQKFEISIELLWKTIQSYMLAFHEIDCNSPKTSITEFLNVKCIDEETYEVLHKMLTDRNTLSHIYNENQFLDIHKRIPGYLKTMVEVLGVLEKKKK